MTYTFGMNARFLWNMDVVLNNLGILLGELVVSFDNIPLHLLDCFL